MADPAPAALPCALTLGDPAGVGPEVAAKAWAARDSFSGTPFFAIGDIASVKAVWDGPVARVDTVESALAAFPDALPVWHLEDSGPVTPGRPTLEGATCALHALETGIGLSRTQMVLGLVTGPISKHQLHRVGFTHPGQTEFIAERCGIQANNAVMMLAAPTLRVVPLTIHIPISEVPAALSTELIVSRGRITARGLARNFGIAAPRLAIAGLNPHAGENGDIGDEELAVIAPAIATLRDEGIDIDGPLAADTMFVEGVRARYDALLCAYHDQALAPFKALHFHDGVNITLGLPIVRTSADHGTAFGLAGKNVADPRPTIAALTMAAAAASHREADAQP